MEDIIYDALHRYYEILNTTGKTKDANSFRILILKFIRDLVHNDYKGLIKEEQYRMIDEALNRIYGTSCLIPYYDYLKMGKLYLGNNKEIISAINRVKEEFEEFKRTHDENNDVVIQNSNRITATERNIQYIQGSIADITDDIFTINENIDTINETSVIKNKVDIIGNIEEISLTN